VKKRIIIGLLVVLLAAGGALAALWYRDQTTPKVVRGSAAVEYERADRPGEMQRPPRVVRRLPWPQYGYDPQRTHVATDFRHRPPYLTLWSVETRAYIEFPPAVANGRLFVSNQKGFFFAVDVRRGKVVWRKRWRYCIAAGPATAFGLVYQGVMNPFPCRTSGAARQRQRGFVVAMNVKNGRVRWRFDAGAIESSPLIVGRTVYVTSWDHRVYALNALTGRVRWSRDVGEELDGGAAYGAGSVFVGGNQGHVFALDAQTGRIRWRASSFARFGRREYFYATPTVAYGRVYVGNTDGTLYAFGARSGRLLWARPAGSYVYTAAAVWRDRVYAGTYDGTFAAFDAATGEVVWRWDAPGAIHGAPTVMGGLVYFSTASFSTGRAQRAIKQGGRGTYALDARTGRLVWQRPGVGQYSPIVADETRVYLTGATRVYALLPEDTAKAEIRRTLQLYYRVHATARFDRVELRAILHRDLLRRWLGGRTLLRAFHQGRLFHPEQQLNDAAELAQAEYRIRLEGATAVVRAPDGATFRLRFADGRWQIAAFR
jgi:outer membrane protein assembly factor BamB